MFGAEFKHVVATLEGLSCDPKDVIFHVELFPERTFYFNFMLTSVFRYDQVQVTLDQNIPQKSSHSTQLKMTLSSLHVWWSSSECWRIPLSLFRTLCNSCTTATWAFMKEKPSLTWSHPFWMRLSRTRRVATKRRKGKQI